MLTCVSTVGALILTRSFVSFSCEGATRVGNVWVTWFVTGFGAGAFTFCRLVLCSLTSSDVDFGRGSNSTVE